MTFCIYFSYMCTSMTYIFSVFVHILQNCINNNVKRCKSQHWKTRIFCIFFPAGFWLHGYFLATGGMATRKVLATDADRKKCRRTRNFFCIRCAACFRELTRKSSALRHTPGGGAMLASARTKLRFHTPSLLPPYKTQLLFRARSCASSAQSAFVC